MKPLSGKEVAKLLEKNGWQLLRVREATTFTGNQKAL
jgi:predicted RNA binding protein YcfA (HicA-like mRNA interferase family)